MMTTMVTTTVMATEQRATKSTMMATARWATKLTMMVMAQRATTMTMAMVMTTTMVTCDGDDGQRHDKIR